MSSRPVPLFETSFMLARASSTCGWFLRCLFIEGRGGGLVCGVRMARHNSIRFFLECIYCDVHVYTNTGCFSGARAAPDLFLRLPLKPEQRYRFPAKFQHDYLQCKHCIHKDILRTFQILWTQILRQWQNYNSLGTNGKHREEQNNPNPNNQKETNSNQQQKKTT